MSGELHSRSLLQQQLFSLSLALVLASPAVETFNRADVAVTDATITNSTAWSRKLIQFRDSAGTNGIRSECSECSKDDIVIFQGSTAPLPNGIPTYTVEIINTSVCGCSISDIHLSCEWFSSVRLVNPRVFRRITYDDCLVNDGQPLGPGEALSFQYANTFKYPLSVSSIACN